MNWRKATESSNHGQCVEIASWRTSSHSIHNGQCVQAGTGPQGIGVRDSQLGAASEVLAFSAGAWSAFTAGLKGRE